MLPRATFQSIPRRIAAVPRATFNPSTSKIEIIAEGLKEGRLPSNNGRS